MREDADSKAKEENDNLEKAMDDTVDEALFKMDHRTRERLVNELADGADISYQRV